MAIVGVVVDPGFVVVLVDPGVVVVGDPGAVVDDDATVVVGFVAVFFGGLFESRTTNKMTTATTTSPLATRRACFIRFALRCSWATLT